MEPDFWRLLRFDELLEERSFFCSFLVESFLLLYDSFFEGVEGRLARAGWGRGGGTPVLIGTIMGGTLVEVAVEARPAGTGLGSRPCISFFDRLRLRVPGSALGSR